MTTTRVIFALFLMVLLIILGLFGLVRPKPATISPPPKTIYEHIVVSVPGPHNLSYLPIDLIPVIGADKTEAVHLQILHTGGGAVAMNNMIKHDADFAVAGVPAAMSLRSNGGDVVVIAPVDDAPLFVLMVRKDLQDQVKRIADLKGKVIGVNTSTKASKTTSSPTQNSTPSKMAGNTCIFWNKWCPVH